jgi:DNA-binding transcriptional MerR regulator
MWCHASMSLEAALQQLGITVPAALLRSTLAIGEFAQLCEVPPSTIRYYTQLGLLDPVRRSGRYRFDGVSLCQFRSVRQRQELGFTLEEITQRGRLLAPGRLVQELVGPVVLDSVNYDWAILIIERETREKGFYQTLSLALKAGEEPDEAAAGIYAELRAELEIAQSRLQTSLESLQNRLARLQEMFGACSP